MKTILITIDDFGRSLFGYAPCSEAFEACDFRHNGESKNTLVDRLGVLGIRRDSLEDRRVSVVADAESPESCKAVESLVSILYEQLQFRSLYVYFAGREFPYKGSGSSVLLGLPHCKRTYWVRKTAGSEDVAKQASYVMLVHEVMPLMTGGSHGAPMVASAWPVSTLHAEAAPGEEGARRSRLQDILPQAFEAVDLLMEDLRRRLVSALDILPTLDRWEERTYRSLVKPVERLVKNLVDEPQGSHWDAMLECLPHSLDAQARLTLSLREIVDPAERGRLADVIAESIGDVLAPPAEVDATNEKQVKCDSPDSPDEILKGLFKLETMQKDRPAVFREKVEANCRHLLRALESPLIRRRMLETLLCFVLKKRQGKGDELDPVRDELRRHLHQVRGGGIFLILPKNSIEERRRNELRDWVEHVMGSPCEIVLTESNESAWLYVETPYEGDWAAHEAPFRKLEEPPKSGEHGEPLSGGPPPAPPLFPPRSPFSPPPPPPSPPSGHCPDCGAPYSAPRLNVPPEPGGTSHRNGSRPRKTCPTCGRLNAKEWWVCRKHVKEPVVPVFIPIDKVRCPDCILCHHEDPEGFPLSKISVRPGYQEPLNCPNCENMRHWDPGHPVFEIPESLARFYRDGVNGHDSVHFKAVVRESGLLGNCYCPNCGTLLIPVHHRNRDASLPS